MKSKNKLNNNKNGHGLTIEVNEDEFKNKPIEEQNWLIFDTLVKVVGQPEEGKQNG